MEISLQCMCLKKHKHICHGKCLLQRLKLFRSDWMNLNKQQLPSPNQTNMKKIWGLFEIDEKKRAADRTSVGADGGSCLFWCSNRRQLPQCNCRVKELTPPSRRRQRKFPQLQLHKIKIFREIQEHGCVDAGVTCKLNSDINAWMHQWRPPPCTAALATCLRCNLMQIKSYGQTALCTVHLLR